MSEKELLPEREARLKEIRSIGLSDDFAGCPGEWVAEMWAYLGAKYGSPEGYFDRIGVDSEERERLRGELLIGM